MITLKAKIELLKSGLNPNENGRLVHTHINSEGTNVSSEIGAILGTKKRTTRPFIFGKSVLGKGDYFASNVGYFISEQMSTEEGNFAPPYRLVINGTNINAITICFDSINNAFPKSINVDGKDIFDDDNSWTFKVDSADSHIITITNWNKPNSPLVISGIFIDLNIDIDRHNKQNIEYNIFDRADISMPSFGIISNNGTIDFIDTDGEVKDYAEQQILKSGLNVTIYLNDSLTKVSEVIAVMKTADWNYDSYNREVNVSLKDDLEEWQEITVEGIEYDPSVPKSKTFKEIYEHLYKQTPSKYNMLTFNSLDEKTKEVLQNTVIQYPTMGNDTLWNEWNKLCQACLLHIYKDTKGNTICRYGGGN